MIYSMTGYGRASQILNGREITVEVKSVNHRYFEPSIRLPRALSYIEQPLRELLSSRVSRGKVDLGVTVVNREASDTEIAPNIEVARGYLNAVATVAGELGLVNNLTADALARFPDVFSVERREIDEDEASADILLVASEALNGFSQMRAAEGERLFADIAAKISEMEALVEQIEREAAENQKRYFDRIYARMREVLDASDIDEARILAEAAIFADRAAVDEETVRLRSHMAQLRGFGNASEPVGKKMDFLMQEFNREANTIGSKANNIETTKLVVELKALIEKIREQVQNVE